MCAEGKFNNIQRILEGCGKHLRREDVLGFGKCVRQKLGIETHGQISNKISNVYEHEQTVACRLSDPSNAIGCTPDEMLPMELRAVARDRMQKLTAKLRRCRSLQ